MTPQTIVITGMGMNTPVGNSAPQTCAALRAGISRLRAWSGFAYAGESIVAAGLTEEAREDPWVAKAVDMVRPTLFEALWQAALYDHTAHKGRRVGLFLATPPAERVGIEAADYQGFVVHVQDVWWELTRNTIARLPAKGSRPALLARRSSWRRRPESSHGRHSGE